jgi:hypothetical protein
LFDGVFGGFDDFAEVVECGHALGVFAQAVERGDVARDVGAGEEGDGGDHAEAGLDREGGEVGVDVGEVEGEERGVVVGECGQQCG